MNEAPVRVQDEPRPDEDGGGQLTSRDVAGAGAATRSAGQSTERTPLFNREEAETFRSRWIAIQGQFVDEPRQAVQEADELVAETMQRLAQIFATEREGLESDWDRGGDVTTEDLRVTLQRYRSFFDRLLVV